MRLGPLDHDEGRDVFQHADRVDPHGGPAQHVRGPDEQAPGDDVRDYRSQPTQAVPCGDRSDRDDHEPDDHRRRLGQQRQAGRDPGQHQVTPRRIVTPVQHPGQECHGHEGSEQGVDVEQARHPGDEWVEEQQPAADEGGTEPEQAPGQGDGQRDEPRCHDGDRQTCRGHQRRVLRSPLEYVIPLVPVGRERAGPVMADAGQADPHHGHPRMARPMGAPQAPAIDGRTEAQRALHPVPLVGGHREVEPDDPRCDADAEDCGHDQTRMTKYPSDALNSPTRCRQFPEPGARLTSRVRPLYLGADLSLSGPSGKARDRRPGYAGAGVRSGAPDAAHRARRGHRPPLSRGTSRSPDRAA